MRVLVCGSRHYSDYKRIHHVLNMTHVEHGISHLIEGGQTGADRIARKWAIASCVPFTTFEADWNSHGRAAGPIRNQKMLDDGKPDVVFAFPEGGPGTRSMIALSEKAGVKTLVFE